MTRREAGEQWAEEISRAAERNPIPAGPNEVPFSPGADSKGVRFQPWPRASQPGKGKGRVVIGIKRKEWERAYSAALDRKRPNGFSVGDDEERRRVGRLINPGDDRSRRVDGQRVCVCAAFSYAK